jgi:membrane protease YdiL (CAAX protease family)
MLTMSEDRGLSLPERHPAPNAGEAILIDWTWVAARRRTSRGAMKEVERDATAARGLLPPCVGVATAIAITSVMDATGLSTFSALPLAPLLAVFWRLQRFSRRQVGFTWGSRDYAAAVLYPIIVTATLCLVAALAGDVDLSHAHWGKASLNLVLTIVATVLVAIITEEGFFRGWLWASLERAGLSAGGVLVWSSLAFAAWHWSSVFLNTDFAPPRAQAPILMLNAAVLGAAFGLLRLASGSVVVSSVSHGIWNGLAYVLFGFGTRVGVLGIKHTGVFGPELGLLGLALNVASVVALWIRYRSKVERSTRVPILGSET